MAAIRPLVAGNWKMNGLAQSVSEGEALLEMLGSGTNIEADAMICPPATLVSLFADRLAGRGITIGGQDCHAEISGAHTGDIAAEMLADAGAGAVIVGHSERRTDHGETDAMVLAKARAAHRAGLTAIICVGETEAQRDAGQALAVVGDQLAGSVPAEASQGNTIIAYEPVWAIGTGRTPTVADVADMHAHIRSELAGTAGEENSTSIRILYGGSVKPANASELMAIDNVNGALVGGASLKADDFYGILSAYAGK